jgi:hypothetical protein
MAAGGENLPAVYFWLMTVAALMIPVGVDGLKFGLVFGAGVEK